MTIPAETRLGHYEIRSLLGAGGMGEVYLGFDLSLHRDVAVKVLRADLTTDRERLERFQREAYAASCLNHPNILTVYQFGHQDEFHFIVTEFVDGESLGKQIKHAPLPPLQVLEIAIQIASALSEAHAARIIHRDIKSDNIMLRRDGLVKVLDFGLAKLGEQASAGRRSRALARAFHTTTPGAVMGTPPYMSPEQTQGMSLDSRTDIWSLGVVIYEMATGHLPFVGQTLTDLIMAILKKSPPPLAEYVPTVPAGLERIVTKALRKDKKQRYQSVQDLELDLKTLKHRLEFEAELERTRVTDGRDEHATLFLPTGGTARVPEQTAQTLVDTEATYVRSPSRARRSMAEITRHKAWALLLLPLIVIASIGAYFTYAHYSTGGRKAAITSLAVLPFANTGNDPAKEYLADGLSESLINRLSLLPGVKVIANTSSFRYKGLDRDPGEIARALDVAGILTGKVMQRGDDLSVSVELIDGRDMTHVWGEQYNRKAADLLQVQAEAYQLLLQAQFYRFKGGIEDRKKAVQYLNQAIAVDPGYALAYAELSDTYRGLVGSSILDPKEYLPRAEAAARTAIELDENLAEAHYALANLMTYKWQWLDAEQEYKRAIALNPNLALVHRWYALNLGLTGKYEQAMSEIKRAAELDPLSPAVNGGLGNVLYYARQYDQAIEALRKTLELDKNYPFAHVLLGNVYAAKGMSGEAITAYRDAINLGFDTPSTQIFLGAAYAQSGENDKAKAILKQLQTSHDNVSPAQLAMLFVALGEREEAFALLNKAYEAHDLQLQYLRVSPGYDSLRSDSRFQDLLRRIGLAS
jgi:serine/threonine protein kinase/TolB-like protein/Flp pilus assembly protein TadD